MATGGYDLDFVDNPSQDYECPICLLVLRDPQMVSCCGRKYCRSCIERVNDAEKPCPFCKEKFHYMAEKQLNRRILDLKVKCTQSKYGCMWDGEIRQVENHISSCSYLEITCSLGCGEVFQRQYLEEHEVNECSKRPMEAKMLSLARKLEVQLQAMEAKCLEQDLRIKELEKEVGNLKECNQKQGTELVSLRQSIQEANSGQQMELMHSLRAIEGELIRRCFCFSLCLSPEESSWISPSFFSHQKGYLLQLSAGIKKFQSVFHSLVFNVFQSGGRPDRHHISLSLNILPQQQDEAQLDWPVYVSVDVLVLCNTDSDANAKLHTVTCFKGSKDDPVPLPDEDQVYVVIGHAQHSFSCRLVVIRIDFGSEPPVVETDSLQKL